MKQKRNRNYVVASPSFHVEKGTKTVVCTMRCCLQLSKVCGIAPSTIHNVMADKLPYIKVVEVKNGNNVRYIGGCFVTEGRATCSGDDAFDFKVGKRIAESRAKEKAYAKAAKAWKVALKAMEAEIEKIKAVANNCDLSNKTENAHISDLVK